MPRVPIQKVPVDCCSSGPTIASRCRPWSTPMAVQWSSCQRTRPWSARVSSRPCGSSTMVVAPDSVLKVACAMDGCERKRASPGPRETIRPPPRNHSRPARSRKITRQRLAGTPSSSESTSTSVPCASSRHTVASQATHKSLPSASKARRGGSTVPSAARNGNGCTCQPVTAAGVSASSVLSLTTATPLR